MARKSVRASIRERGDVRVRSEVGKMGYPVVCTHGRVCGRVGPSGCDHTLREGAWPGTARGRATRGPGETKQWRRRARGSDQGGAGIGQRPGERWRVGRTGDRPVPAARGWIASAEEGYPGKWDRQGTAAARRGEAAVPVSGSGCSADRGEEGYRGRANGRSGEGAVPIGRCGDRRGMPAVEPVRKRALLRPGPGFCALAQDRDDALAAGCGWGRSCSEPIAERSGASTAVVQKTVRASSIGSTGPSAQRRYDCSPTISGRSPITSQA